MIKHARIEWLDFAKGFVILMVVLGHSLLDTTSTNLSFKVLEYILISFVMPVFFAVSGFLYNPSNNFKQYKLLLYKKISSFFLPYIIFTFVDVLLHMTSNHNVLDNIYRIYYIPIGYLWFLYSLFFIFIIVGLMDVLHIKLFVQVSISFILMLSQIYLPWQENISGNMNPLAGIGGYMSCFYLGYIIKIFNLTEIFKRRKNLIYFTTIWIILLVFNMKITGVNYNTDVFNYGDIIIKLISIPTFFTIFINFKNNKVFKYFDKYGRYTLVIYLVHLPVISTTGKILTKLLLTNTVLLSIICAILGWYVSIFVCYLAKHTKIIDFIFYPRKYINKVILKTEWGKKLLEK